MVKLLNSLYLGASTPDDYGKAQGVIELLPFDLYLGSAVPSKVNYIDVILSGVSPLVLTKAIADGLNYLKLFGGTEQRNLPEGYTQVEYLQSSGTQWIDTGKAIKANQTVKCKMALNAAIQTGWMGAIDAVNSLVRFGVTNNMIYCQRPTTGGVYIASDTDFHTFIASPTELRIDNNSDTINVTTDMTTSFALFAQNDGRTSDISAYLSCKISEFEITEGNTLIQKLIPCKNSSNVLGMYDTVSNTFLTNAGTGDFTAGSDVVPTPDTPMDIVCNNGVVKLSKNLYNDATRVNNYYISANGTITANTGSCYSDLIPVKPDTQYIFSGKQTEGISSKRVHAYNSSGNWVQQLNSSDGSITNYTVSFTTTSSTAYVRISLLIADTDVQVEQGSTVTPYVPYSPTGIYVDGTTETVAIHGKNLFDKSAITSGVRLNNTSAYEYGTVGQDFLTDASYYVSPLIEVVSGQTYYKNSPTADAYHRVHYYDINKICTRISSSNTIQPTTGECYVAFCGLLTEVDTTQLELGSTATTYEPYYSGGTATAQDLYAVGTYKDVQSVLDGAVTRQIGIKVFDGTESWSSGGNNTGVYMTLGSAGSFVAGTGYCTHSIINPNSPNIVDMNQNEFCLYSNGNMSFKNAYTTSYSDWKDYLAQQYNAGTPVIIVYPLATATTESVTAQTLTTQSGTNTVEITQASMDGLTMEVSYKQRV